jgi:23S rRNA U2552 (ribose-2'-O)-methylase RlmE/FtsJ
MDSNPWETNNFLSIHTLQPTPHITQTGWKSSEHSSISAVKNRIAGFSNADEWEIRKKITNPYEPVFSGEDTFPSLAKVEPLSRSYFKMIEMLGLINFFDNRVNTEPFISAHICEGPGGFIQHVVEELTKRKISTKAIYAMTLKPTKSHIPGWRRSIHFLKRYPQIQLEYGVDDTGNILKLENQTHFCKKANGADLFTADGGFDFSVNYTNQEQMAFPLLLASFTMGLQSLKVGGTMIIKLFDIYGRATQDLFLGSATFFDRFTLYKPATSRPCNSERYFIATGFLGTSVKERLKAWIKTLEIAQMKHMESPITQLIEGEWPEEIIEAVQEQIEMQEKIQIQCIEDTLTLDKDTIAERLLKNIRLSKEWCKAFDVPY